MAYVKGDFLKIAYRTDIYNWKDVGIHYATLNSAAEQGLVEKVSTGCYRTLPKMRLFCALEDYAASHDFIHLFNIGDEFGKLCVLKGFKLYDGFDKIAEYDHESFIWIKTIGKYVPLARLK